MSTSTLIKFTSIGIPIFQLPYALVPCRSCYNLFVRYWLLLSSPISRDSHIFILRQVKPRSKPFCLPLLQLPPVIWYLIKMMLLISLASLPLQGVIGYSPLEELRRLYFLLLDVLLVALASELQYILQMFARTLISPQLCQSGLRQFALD